MTKSILAMIMLMLTIVLAYVSYKHLKKKYKNKPYISSIFIVSVLAALLILFLGTTGIRLTPLQASRANAFVEADADLLKEIKVSKNYFHIYYNPTEKLYRTTFTEGVGIFYKSNTSTWYYPHEEDMVRTLGGSTVLIKEEYESVLYVASKDPQVTEIAVIDSNGNYVVRQPVKVGEPAIVQYKYPASVNTSNYSIVALNNKLDAIYYYGYELKDNQTSADEYKWHEMEKYQLNNKFEVKIKSGNLCTNYSIDKALSDIEILGLNTLNIPVVINIKDLSASDMSIDNYSKEQAITLIKKLQGKRINVILEPYPWIDNGSKIETEWLPENTDAFFSNWKEKVLKPLIDDIAVPYHVEALYIGSNFSQIEHEEAQFCEMVDYVKGYYKGLVTYRTNWWTTVDWNNPATKKTQEELRLAYEKKLNNELFSKLDFISIAAYFELTGNDTNTVDNLINSIQSTQIHNRKQNVKQEIKNFYTKWNKPIFFGELGFPPTDKASFAPWNPRPTNKVNGKEQANCFEAYKAVFENEPWHLGFSIFAIGRKDTDNHYYPSDNSIEIIKGWYTK
jgi:hypothetical protein